MDIKAIAGKLNTQNMAKKPSHYLVVINDVKHYIPAKNNAYLAPSFTKLNGTSVKGDTRLNILG